jgi:tetratricopeptide (TPR) repeat protein
MSMSSFCRVLFMCLLIASRSTAALPAEKQPQPSEDLKKGVALNDEKKYDEAIPYFTKAIAADGKNSDAYTARACAMLELGKYDEAIADCDKAVSINPRDAIAYYNRGLARDKKGDVDKAIEDYGSAIRLSPKDQMYNNRGNAWSRKGEFDKAIEDFDRALDLNPKLELAYRNRGWAWLNKKDYDKAIADFNKAIPLISKDPETLSIVHRLIAQSRDKKGEYDKALDGYKEAIKINPKFVLAYNELAWLLATCCDAKYRDGKEAVKNANQAVKLDDGKDWNLIDTLAAAYAESGDFSNAVAQQEKAVSLAADDKSVSKKDLEEVRAHLKLYQDKKPYHQEELTPDPKTPRTQFGARPPVRGK